MSDRPPQSRPVTFGQADAALDDYELAEGDAARSAAIDHLVATYEAADLEVRTYIEGTAGQWVRG